MHGHLGAMLAYPQCKTPPLRPPPLTPSHPSKTPPGKALRPQPHRPDPKHQTMALQQQQRPPNSMSLAALSAGSMGASRTCWNPSSRVSTTPQLTM